MRERESLAHLIEDPDRLIGRKLSGVPQVAQIHSIHVFHQQVTNISRMAVVIDSNHVRMIQPCHRAGFARESFGEQTVSGQFLRQDLQGNDAIEFRLTNFEDAAHARRNDRNQRPND